MLTTEADNQAKADREAKAQKAEPEATTTEPVATEPVTEPTELAEKPKGKRSRAKQPVKAE